MAGVYVSFRCDDRCKVYADGDKIIDQTDGYTINIIPRATRVVAIQGYNDRSGAYIVGGFSNGFQTVSGSDKWKCTDQEYLEWKTAVYDDSGWSPAADHGSDSDIKFGSGATARKIWTKDIPTDSYVYCRGHIGEQQFYSILFQDEV